MDIINLVNSGAQFKVEVNSFDLMKFAEELIKRAMEEQRLLDVARMAQTTTDIAEGEEKYH